MIILGIETSCDETAAAVIEGHTDTQPLTILSNVVASSMNEHAKTGGIIPEAAARNQIHAIIPVITKALTDAQLQFSRFHPPAIDAIAITVGPGLIGSLLVGVETAKTLAITWKKPLIPVNHLFGHMYANFLTVNQKPITFPALALVVSGGHTDLVLLHDHTYTTWLGGTRDDAAGEAIDKIGRSISFPYPAGPAFEKAALGGDSKAYRFPRPIMHDNAYDFSFSGLKTAAIREIQKVPKQTPTITNNIARCVQDAIIDVLSFKTIKAAEAYNVQTVLLGGGVASNQALRARLQQDIEKKNLMVQLIAPEKFLCVDNAAMIGAVAYFKNTVCDPFTITANPELYFD